MADHNDVEFDLGVQAGASVGHYKAYQEVKLVFETLGASGVEAWLDKNKPRTMEEWAEYEKENSRE